MSKVKTGAAVALLAGVSLAVGVYGQSVQSAHGDILVQSTGSWNGRRYGPYPKQQPQLTVLKMTVPPRTALPWHTHPFPNAGYVLQGQLTIEDKASGEKRTFHKGQAFTESVNDVHRGVSGPEVTVLIITYSGIPGVPTFKAEPGQKPEY